MHSPSIGGCTSGDSAFPTVTSLSRAEHGTRCILVALLALGAFLLLYIFRAADDNRLTSWQWVFADADIALLFVSLCAALGAAYLFALRIGRIRRQPLLLFVGAFAIGTVFWKEPEIIVDSARYFSQAKSIELYGVTYFLREWGYAIPVWTDLPLVPFLFGLALQVAGESRFAIQVSTTLLFATTVLLTYYIGRDLWSKQLGLMAGALLLATPYLLIQVPLVMVDVPSMCFLTLAVFATVRAVQTGGTLRVAVAAAAITLAAMAKYSTWLMLSVVPVIGLVELSRQGNVVLRRMLAISGATALLAIPLLLWWGDVFLRQLDLLRSYQLPGLHRWGESYVSTFLFQLHPFVVIAAVVGVFVAVRRKDARFLIIGWMLMLLLLLEVKRIRYTVIVFPMLALMAAYGLSLISDSILRRFVVLAAAATSVVVAVLGHLAFVQTMSAANLQRAGDYLNTAAADVVEVYTLPQRYSIINPAISVPILDLFTHKPIVYRRGVGDRDAAPPPQFATSSLRFSWEFPLSGYYDAGPRSTPDGDKAIVVIRSDSSQTLPASLRRDLAGFELTREFRQLSGVFRYRTIVQIYQRIKNT